MQDAVLIEYAAIQDLPNIVGNECPVGHLHNV